MKLIVQIPCYNEEATLAQTVADIPKSIAGIDVIEVLVIDDGSTDGTCSVARQIGVHHFVRNKSNVGLAQTFAKGIEACLRQGADIIVNTDGDNQYAGHSIPDLVQPILEGRADIVIGDRNTGGIGHFSTFKKVMQKLGSGVIRHLTGLSVSDVVSGFRAYNRNAAIGLNVFSDFSYTVETLIQADSQNRTVVSVSVDTNPKTRDSRLSGNIWRFLGRQTTTIVRSYTMYRSLRVFSTISLLFVLVGAIPIIRFLYFYLQGDGDGRIQSLILGGVFVTLGYVTFVASLLADATATNRKLLEATLEKVRALELNDKSRDAPEPAESEDYQSDASKPKNPKRPDSNSIKHDSHPKPYDKV